MKTSRSSNWLDRKYIFLVCLLSANLVFFSNVDNYVPSSFQHILSVATTEKTKENSDGYSAVVSKVKTANATKDPPSNGTSVGTIVSKVLTANATNDPRESNGPTPPNGVVGRGSAEFCLERRGTRGRWIQDWEYAKRSSYRYHESYLTWHIADKNFTPTPSQPHRLATSYRWVDDECPVNEVDVNEFCDACVTLGIDRILVLGDSMNLIFAQSLQGLLGFPPTGRRANEARNEPWEMVCPTKKGSGGPSPSSSGGHRVEFLAMRYSPHEDWIRLGKEARNKNGRARHFIDQSSHKTAIVANLGAWMRNTTQYKEGFTWFLDWMDSLEDPSKVVPFWRPTIPGHLGCRPGGKKDQIKGYNWVKPVLEQPYANYSDYKQSQDILLANGTNSHRWELFEGWNDWSYQKLYGTNSTHFGKRARVSFGNHSSSTIARNHTAPRINSSSGNRSTTINWLNVFPSSVLRRDGHVGFGDCLHYYLPGPIDWWAHLFHSALLDLANITTTTRQQFARDPEFVQQTHR